MHSLPLTAACLWIAATASLSNSSSGQSPQFPLGGPVLGSWSNGFFVDRGDSLVSVDLSGHIISELETDVFSVVSAPFFAARHAGGVVTGSRLGLIYDLGPPPPNNLRLEPYILSSFDVSGDVVSYDEVVFDAAGYYSRHVSSQFDTQGGNRVIVDHFASRDAGYVVYEDLNGSYTSYDFYSRGYDGYGGSISNTGFANWNFGPFASTDSGDWIWVEWTGNDWGAECLSGGGMPVPPPWDRIRGGTPPLDIIEYRPGFPFFREIATGAVVYEYGRPSLTAILPLGTHDLWKAGRSLFCVTDEVLRFDQVIGWLPVPEFSGAQTTFIDDNRGFLAQRELNDIISLHKYQSGSWPALLDGFDYIGSDWLQLGSTWVFCADKQGKGRELWTTDASWQATRLAADLSPGASSSNPRHFRVSNGVAYFVADHPRPNTLWRMETNDLDWTRNPSNGHLYKLTAPSSWHSALAQARSDGGTLATIRSQAEQDWLWTEFGPDNLWIGLEDLDLNGVFEWSSGEPLNFATWCPGQPNGGSQGESVVHMGNYPGWCTGPWNDQHPTDIYRGIIERTPNPSPVEEIGSGCHGATATWAFGMPTPGERLGLRFDMGPNFGSGLVAAITGLTSQAPPPVDLGSLLGDPNLSNCMLFVRPLSAPVAAVGSSSLLIEWDLPASLPPQFDLDVQGLGVSAANQLATTNLVRVRVD
jgi:ELWxxDGT repeat protein